MKMDHEFVTHIPERLEEGVLYVSLEFATVVHKCACGCGEEVVTPLGPGEWQLTYDRTVSLAPSVGNWSFQCRSHYWIEGSRVRWARDFSGEEVASIRRRARARRDAYFSNGEGVRQEAVEGTLAGARESGLRRKFVEKIRAWFGASSPSG